MAIQTRKCSNCGAPVPLQNHQCDYCGSWFEDKGRVTSSVSPRPGPTHERLQAADFGKQGKGYILACFQGAILIYIVGWSFEDTVYWLDTTAVIIWAGVLPLWMAVFSFTWSASKGQWLPGLIFSIPLFVIHLTIMWVIDQRIYDDSVGISAGFAGAALGAWLIGRALHIMIQRVRAKPN
jgi:hypothetical protein